MAKPSRALTATAYHEAGHAVAAVELRIRMRRVTIVPDTDAGSLGHVDHAYPPGFNPGIYSDRRTMDRIERGILFLLAGPVAEAKFTGRHNRVGAGSDYRSAVDLACHAVGSPEAAGAYIGWLVYRTRGVLFGPMVWPTVEAVAAELLAHKTLTVRQVRQAMADRRQVMLDGWAAEASPPTLTGH